MFNTKRFSGILLAGLMILFGQTGNAMAATYNSLNYADAVHSFTAGTETAEPYTDPNSALGEEDGLKWSPFSTRVLFASA